MLRAAPLRDGRRLTVRASLVFADMAEVLLVHGAWHGGWCWREVADQLTAAGHRVVRPTLSGLADRSHLLSPAVNLDTHIADIVLTVEFEEMDEVVLVCHSYGGVPGVGAADRLADRCAALVLLDAMLPIDGMSSNEVRDRIGPARPLDLSHPLVVPPPSATVFGLTGSTARRVDALLTPHPLGTLTQPIRLTGAHEDIGVKRYHRATRYEAGYFDDAAQRASDQGTWQVSDHDLDHDMMLTDPAWTVATIEDAIAATRGRRT